MTGQGVPTMPVMDGYTLKVEPLACHIETEMAPLFEGYFDELVCYPRLSRIDLKASAEVYRDLEARDVLFWVSLRYGAALVGFVAMFVTRQQHFGYVQAQSDMLYLAPAHRRGNLALRLIDFAECAARVRGCQIVSWGAKQGTQAAELFARLGYLAQDVYYTKGL